MAICRWGFADYDGPDATKAVERAVSLSASGKLPAHFGRRVFISPCRKEPPTAPRIKSGSKAELVVAGPLSKVSARPASVPASQTAEKAKTAAKGRPNISEVKPAQTSTPPPRSAGNARKKLGRAKKA